MHWSHLALAATCSGGAPIAILGYTRPCQTKDAPWLERFARLLAHALGVSMVAIYNV